jgi:hypothetical protein
MAVNLIQLITIASGARAASVAVVAPRERATAIARDDGGRERPRASCRATTPPSGARP